MSHFQVPSTIQKMTTLVDGTWRLTVDCQELPPEQELELVKLKKKIGWFLFKENPIKEEDVPEETAPEFKGEKTPSKRQYDILYVIWREQGSKGSFNDFYKSKMEQIATWLKEKYLE